MNHTKPVALVTGSGRNIGLSIAKALAGDGFDVVVNVRQGLDEGRAAVEQLKACGSNSLLIQADVTDESAVFQMMSAIQDKFGRLDVLVNNAAIRREASIENLVLQEWKQTLAVVLDGAYLCTKAALPLLKQSPSPSVINIGGLTGHTGARDRVHVVTAKAGLVGFTRAIAHDLAEWGVTCNCVSPGMIQTVRNSSSSPAAPKHHAVHHPLLGRRGSAEEVAHMVRWLASDQARFVTGQVLHVNGGTYLGA